MIQTQYLTEIRTIVTTAERHSVTLPGDFTAKAAHLLALEDDHRAHTAPSVGHIATDLARHLGNPSAMAKARAKAAADLAAAEAAGRISAALVDRCASLLRQNMRSNADAITEAFAPAAADAVQVLNDDAAKLPTGFRPEDAATLDPATFAAWTRVRDARALLESLFPALRPLYATPADSILTADAVRALRYVKPPTLDNPTEAQTFARALAGTQLGGSHLGPATVQGLYAPAAVAHLGGTFEWAGTNAVADRAAAINAAATPQVVERNGPRAYVTL